MWRVEPYRTTDKRIVILGPHELVLYVDYDDVNHDAVDEQIPRIVAALNEGAS